MEDMQGLDRGTRLGKLGNKEGGSVITHSDNIKQYLIVSQYQSCNLALYDRGLAIPRREAGGGRRRR